MNFRALSPTPQYQNTRLYVVIHDVLVAALAWILARWVASIHFDVAWPAGLSLAIEGLLLLSVQGFIYWRIGLYRGLWRFASLPDLGNLVRSSL
ncbi:MAG: polysaccharide biosynthesis protein, partial [Wenzhouxiangellaceae bacterium]